MKHPYCSVQDAVYEMHKKRIIIIQDHQNREDEGDLYIPAQYVSPDIINFMITHGKGLICVSITAQRARQLDLPLMIPEQENEENTKCSFTISVDARDGIKTGISPYDRAKTIQILGNPNSRVKELVKPGHIFPLVAKEGLLQKRRGHTEAAIQLSTSAGLDPSGVICEIIGDDGHMLRGKKLQEYALKYNLKIITIESLIEFS